MKNQEKEENKLISQRREKLDSLREKGTAFPNSFRRNTNSDDLNERFRNKAKEELESYDEDFAIAGRIIARRGPFIVIQDVYGTMQLYIDKKNLSEIEIEKISLWDIGDIVGSHGKIRKSGKGDLYIYMKESFLLTKSLRPLPEKWHGLTDKEQRYRRRYIDLMVNEEARNIFSLRSKIINYIRDYFIKNEFIEVETPMMHSIPGGATARPFETFHNSLNMNLYLRVAPELYLKRLVVGGYEKVFEINRNFRNEGLSSRHNPEFTMLEFYEAYQDFNILMDRTETLLRGIANDVLGKKQIEYQGNSYDFNKPFSRLTVIESILKFNPSYSLTQIENIESAKKIAMELGIEVKDQYGLGKIQIEIFEKTVEHKLMDPTFITAYPTEVSPLARRNDNDHSVTDRFEFFVGGREIANGFSELNDPEDQANRFKEQVKEKDDGNHEAMHFDDDYIRALEYGLPPTAGEGIGIDRLVMLFTDSPTIRDVLLFPQMRPEE
mgnify:CR=1 FL=1|tara:strand:- start:13289 stop:14770 length:1482 start_codon:yes stop_codon:yes gene_type:complete